LSSGFKFKLRKDTLTPSLRDSLEKMFDRVTTVLFEYGHKTVHEAVQLAREKLENPGSYLQKFQVTIIAGRSYKIRNLHHAARIIEFGTKKKYRVPKSGRAARLIRGTGEKKGKTVPAFIHPGLPPRYIIRDAIKKTEKEFRERLKEALKPRRVG